MTDKEMAEAIQAIISLLDGALDPNNAEPWRDVGRAQGLLGNIIAALEANPPLEAPVLAEVEGEWIRGLAGLPAILFIASADAFQTSLNVPSRNSGYIPVTVTIRGRGDVPEPPATSSSIR